MKIGAIAHSSSGELLLTLYYCFRMTFSAQLPLICKLREERWPVNQMLGQNKLLNLVYFNFKMYLCSEQRDKYDMIQQALMPDFVFETSWEVCNKVGGIYTVLSSRAKTLCEKLSDNLCFIGPDLQGENPLFKEDKRMLPKWQKALREAGLSVRIGRWNIPGKPLTLLVDFTPLFAEKDAIYQSAWDEFHVDSLHAYGDYDEASMFSVAAGRVAECLCANCLPADAKIVYQAHEWMSGMGMMFLKKAQPHVATIFTTHATSIGRSIAGNNKLLYKYFEGYNGDQMASELSMESKHSVEKQSAFHADCFTTVSAFTARECTQLLDKSVDCVLPNGFEDDFVPKGTSFSAKRRAARELIFKVAENLTGQSIDEQTLIISTSGRNDFRCKGFDVYLEALAQLNARLKSKYGDENTGECPTKVLALIEVPCWLLGPREDLLQRMKEKKTSTTPLPLPMITHDLHNLNEDRILCMIKQLGLYNTASDAVKVILIPSYLEGNDGVFNKPYYDILTANDLCIYPSYYEPWGYTPLESCAFNIPCVTTDLSGFGQWVNDELGHEGKLNDGVSVIHRDDDNYYEAARQISVDVEQLLQTPAKERTAVRRSASRLAQKAQWKNFIKYYYEAYDIALSKVVKK